MALKSKVDKEEVTMCDIVFKDIFLTGRLLTNCGFRFKKEQMFAKICVINNDYKSYI